MDSELVEELKRNLWMRALKNIKKHIDAPKKYAP